MRYVLIILLIWPVIVFAQTDLDSQVRELSEEEKLQVQEYEAQMAGFRKLAWQEGPTVGRIGNMATITVPEGHAFLNSKNTRLFLELTDNIPEDGYYLVAVNTVDWFALFKFSSDGYVKDEEKVDSEDLLQKLKDGDVHSNKERRRLGLREMHVVGWEVPPHYDKETNRMEWGIRIRDDTGSIMTNYTIKFLGRSGVMAVTLVSNPESLSKDIRQIKSILKKYEFIPGQKYSEWKAGDKVAAYGLSALILGGAAAVATKKGFWALLVGLFAAFWKVLVGVGIAVLAWIASLLTRKK